MNGQPFQDLLRQLFDQLAFHGIAGDIGSEELVFRNVIGVGCAFSATRDFLWWRAEIKQEPIGCRIKAHAAWKTIAAKPLQLEAIGEPDAQIIFWRNTFPAFGRQALFQAPAEQLPLAFGDQADLHGCKRLCDLRIFPPAALAIHGPKAAACGEQRQAKHNKGASR